MAGFADYAGGNPGQIMDEKRKKAAAQWGMAAAEGGAVRPSVVQGAQQPKPPSPFGAPGAAQQPKAQDPRAAWAQMAQGQAQAAPAAPGFSAAGFAGTQAAPVNLAAQPQVAPMSGRFASRQNALTGAPAPAAPAAPASFGDWGGGAAAVDLGALTPSGENLSAGELGRRTDLVNAVRDRSGGQAVGADMVARAAALQGGVDTGTGQTDVAGGGPGAPPPAAGETPEQKIARMIEEAKADSAAAGGNVSRLDLKENEKAIWNPEKFQAAGNTFQFDQAAAWRDQYGKQAAQADINAADQYNNQQQARNVQGDLLSSAAGRQGALTGAAANADMRLKGTQAAVQHLASGQTDTAGGVGQKSVQAMALDAAAGKGPSASQAQFQRSQDQNISAVRSAMAGNRGMSVGQAARMGGQMTADMGLRAGQDAAVLAAQEQQAGMQLAGNVTGQARGQDLQAVGLGAQLDLGAQKQLGDQAATNLTATGNLAQQARAADIGLYGGETNLANQARGAQLGLDQQQLELKQQEEAFKYKQYQDWQNSMVTQYGGAGNYAAPWEQQAWANAGAGAAGGIAEGIVNWATK